MNEGVERAYTDAPKAFSGNALRSPIGSQVARERSAIEAELSLLRTHLEQAHELIGILNNKVQPVSANYPEEDKAMADHDQNGSSEFYRSLWDMVNTVKYLQGRTVQIIDRLEV